MGLFKKLAKLSLNCVETPISITKDVITLSGLLTDKNQSYTSKNIKDLNRDYKDLKKYLNED